MPSTDPPGPGRPAGEEAAAAWLRALVDGLAAVVWEADAETVAFDFVSERATELLGHPTSAWIGDPGFWPSIIHPEDREAAVAFCAAETAAGRDHDFSYRALAADGRVVWLHDVVHVVLDEHGRPARLQGVMIDITAQKRAERSGWLLAEAGRVLSGPGELADRLTALARLTAGPMGDAALVSLPADDGRFRPVAVAHRDPALEPLLAHAARALVPIGVRDAIARGAPFVVGESGDPDEMWDEVRGEDDPAPPVRRARSTLGSRTALVVPLTVHEQALGLLTFAASDPLRRYDADDVEVAGQLGLRVAAALEADHLRERNQRLLEVTSALAAAPDTAGAAAAVADAARAGLRATLVGLYRLDGGRLRVLHRAGYPEDLDLSAYAVVTLDERLPLTDAVRSAAPLWIDDAAELARRYPEQVAAAAAAGVRALAVLPMSVGGAVTGALTLSFAHDRDTRQDEREFARLLAAQAAQALARTRAADERRSIAETLQRSLLPAAPAGPAGVTIAYRYLPGTVHMQAGGDWYDVLDQPDGRVAVAVGDVVGQGAAAAAVMGQLRSALAAHLLDGDPPARALHKLARFSARIPGARASTAAALVLDSRDGGVRWARAGHLPPLVVGRCGRARYLDGAHGCVLGVPNAPPCTEGTTSIEAGDTVLLYTDGLVERRGETLDDGLARLAAAASTAATAGTAGAGGTAEDFASAVVGTVLGGTDAGDDVALVVTRFGGPVEPGA